MQFGTRLSSVVAAIALVSVACTSDGSEQEASSETTLASVTTLVSTAAAEPQSESTTTTTSVPKTVLSAPEYQIVERIDGDSGDTVIVLLDPETYGTLTDLDLYDLIAEVVELFPPIAVVHIVDEATAANIVANPDASEAERNAVAANYLARLDDGVKIIYLGPFASSGTAVLGS
jgi:hypothetical protein